LPLLLTASGERHADPPAKAVTSDSDSEEEEEEMDGVTTSADNSLKIWRMGDRWQAEAPSEAAATVI